MHCSGRKIPHGGRSVLRTTTHALLSFIISSRYQDEIIILLFKMKNVPTVYFSGELISHRSGLVLRQ